MHQQIDGIDELNCTGISKLLLPLLCNHPKQEDWMLFYEYYCHFQNHLVVETERVFSLEVWQPIYFGARKSIKLNQFNNNHSVFKLNIEKQQADRFD